MAADGMGERVALGSRTDGLTIAELASRARRAGTVLADMPGERVALIDLNSEAVPIALFGATLAGKPFVPINYRLTDQQLRDLVVRTAPATVITGDGIAERLGAIPGIEVLERAAFLERVADPAVAEADPYGGDPESVAVLLYTSGTTGAPKAAVLRNRHLTSYVISTVEFAGAGEDEAAIVSVPPYHIAGHLVRAVVDLLRAPGRARRDVRAAGLGRPGAGRVGHPRHGGPHHAQPHPRRDRRRRTGASRRCGRSPTAGARCRCR